MVVMFQNDLRMALIEFRSHVEPNPTVIHRFTSSMNIFSEWIGNLQNDGGGTDQNKAVGKLPSRHFLMRQYPSRHDS